MYVFAATCADWGKKTKDWVAMAPTGMSCCNIGNDVPVAEANPEKPPEHKTSRQQHRYSKIRELDRQKNQE